MEIRKILAKLQNHNKEVLENSLFEEIVYDSGEKKSIILVKKKKKKRAFEMEF